MKNVWAFLAAVAMVVCLAGFASADVFNMGGTRNPTTGVWTGLASLDMVTVGNPGNAVTGGYGAVAYQYSIGKYDVTAGQYCAFLNAVATQSDPFGLFNSGMTGGPGSWSCGITQTGSPGHYSYNTTSSGYAVNNGNFPVNCVTWADAARFCNWLTNGQPTTAVENLTTTETGSYTLNGAMTDAALMAVTRTASAKYVIPTENEWYKAAYYDPTLSGGAGGYWFYPTKSNTRPGNTLPDTGNNANYCYGTFTDPTNYLTQVGAFADSPGPYGTYDMGGEVWQWNEANFGGSARGLRGWSFYDYQYTDTPAYRNYDSPTYGNYNIGFRVSELPEPATLSLLALGGLAVLRRGRDRR